MEATPRQKEAARAFEAELRELMRHGLKLADPERAGREVARWVATQPGVKRIQRGGTDPRR